jgi:hypothetical protein
MNVSGFGALALLGIGSIVAAQRAHGFGPDGHRIAGLVAETYLCEQASVEISRFGEGDGLAELGLWADRIRTQPPWDDSGPWHYVNIADGDSFDDYRSPPEGDVLWAIAHFRSRLRSENLTREQRTDALKFLVHFVVDLHQPLHVGRRTDRGGTTTEVFLGEKRTSLHRFWDTDVIRDAGLPVAHYARNVMPMATLLAAEHRPSQPRQWAAEGLSLRTIVYDFDPETRRLDEDYMMIASDLVQLRLIQAGLRLADQLNDVFCPANASLGP